MNDPVIKQTIKDLMEAKIEKVEAFKFEGKLYHTQSDALNAAFHSYLWREPKALGAMILGGLAAVLFARFIL